MDMIRYFYSLAIPLRETSKVFTALFTAIARQFDLLYGYGVELVKQAFPKFSSDGLRNTGGQPSIAPPAYGTSLSLFGQERGVVNIKGEPSANYAKRVEKAFGFLQAASTKEGIIALVRQFTAKPFELRELYTDNWVLSDAKELLGVNTLLGWTGSYQFNLVFGQPLTLGERDYITELVNIYKPAHVVFKVIANIADDWLLGNEGEILGISTYL